MIQIQSSDRKTNTSHTAEKNAVWSFFKETEMLGVKEKEKRIKRCSLLIAVFMVMSVMFFPSAEAFGFDFFGAISSTVDAIASFPYAMAVQITTGVTDIIVDTFTPSGTGAGAAMYQTVIGDGLLDEPGIREFMTGLGVIGFAIAIGIAVVHYYDATIKGADAVEQALKMMVEIAIVAIIMLQLNHLVKLLTDAGGVIVENLNPVKEDSDAEQSGLNLLKSIGVIGESNTDGKVSGGLKWFKALGMLIIPYILSLLLEVAAYFAAFSLILEIGIRRLFMPFAIADIYGEGMRSPGMRYLKKYFAVFIKIAICLSVAVLTSILQRIPIDLVSQADGIKNTLVQTLSMLMATISLNFTSIGVMFKGGEYANDIVGA